MAGNYKMPKKRTGIIAAIIIAVLSIIAVTGTTVFLRDRGRAEAAELENGQITRGVEEGTTPGNSGNAGNNNEGSQGGEQTLTLQQGEGAGEQGTNPVTAQENNGGVANNDATAPAGTTPVAQANANTNGRNTRNAAGANTNNGANVGRRVDNIQEAEIIDT